MEVASDGDCIADLIKFSIEMGVLMPTTSRCWEDLFAGYGAIPDFELFQLRLLTASDEELRWTDGWWGHVKRC